VFDNIRADMKVYETEGGWYGQLGFYITATYRFGHWARKIKSPPLRLGARVAHGAMATPWRFFRNVVIPAGAEIGPGLRMVHPQSILIPPGSKIGAGCSIYQEVTLGTGSAPGVPEVGDNVMLFVGAKLLGGIEVGDDVHVGANAVVTKSVPDGATVSAPPSRAIPKATAKVVRR
jgi:serine O-acetyltransferase